MRTLCGFDVKVPLSQDESKGTNKRRRTGAPAALCVHIEPPDASMALSFPNEVPQLVRDNNADVKGVAVPPQRMQGSCWQH